MNWRTGFCHAPPRPQRGTSRRTTFSLSRLRPSVFNSARFAGGVPTHQGVNSGSCGLVLGIGAPVSATPHLPTPAGDKPPHYIFSFRLRPSVYNSARFAGRVPAHQGVKKRELWLGIVNWRAGFCHAPPRPQRGTSLRTTFSLFAFGRRSSVRHCSPVESRHTKVSIAAVVASYCELARWILPRPTSDPSGGQAPALHFLFSPLAVGLGWDGEGEIGALAGLAFDPDAPAVGLDELLGDGESQAGTAGRSAA